MRGARPLKKQEAVLLKSHFKGKMARRNKAMFLLGVNTGYRVSELLSLRIADIVDVDGKMKDRVTVWRRNMKGKKSSRTMLLNEHAKAAMKDWLNELKRMNVVHKDDFIFRSIRGNYPISRVQAWKVLTAAYRECHLGGKLGTHAMRKSFANNIYAYFKDELAKGKAVDPFRSTSKALGHADIKSTDQYLSFLVEEIDEAVESVGI